MDGDSFCIFHKPNKTREEREQFYKALKSIDGVREETAGAYSGFGIGQHTRFVFEEQVDFSGYCFPKVPIVSGTFLFGFGNSIFEKSVSFRNARFYDSVFSRSAFLQDVDFYGAVFHTGVQFDNATFEGKCVFAGTWFNGRTSFASVTFSDYVQFTTALFEETVDFSGVAFNSGADFDVAVFKHSLTFQGADVRSDFSLVNIAETDPSTVDGGLGLTESDQGKSLSEIIRREGIELPSLLISEELQDNGFDIQKNFPI